jgi:hypothetical protein
MKNMREGEKQFINQEESDKNKEKLSEDFSNDDQFFKENVDNKILNAENKQKIEEEDKDKLSEIKKQLGIEEEVEKNVTEELVGLIEKTTKEIAELGENITEEIVEPQENSREKYTILPDESPEHYLKRISKPLKISPYSKSKGRERRFFDRIEQDEIVQIINNLKEVVDKEKKFNKEKNLKNIEKIHLNSFSITNVSENRTADEFSKTEQGRSFFYKGIPTSSDHESYSESLFLLPMKPENAPAVKEYYKQLLNNKNIVLFGGGDSAKDLFKDTDINPEKIINVDPFLKQETYDKNPKGNYYNLDKKADDPTLSDYFKEQGVKADEIWASYSVPLYLKNKEEITALFTNIKNILAENGTCRIYPLATTFNENRLDMNEALKISLKDMVDTGEFNVEENGELLKITKIKKEALKKNTETLQTIDNEKNTVISMVDLKKISTQTGDVILYHGGLPDDTNMDSINLNKVDSKQNKKDKTYGGFYLSDETSKNWSEQYAKLNSSNMHGFLIDKGSRVLEITDRDIDRLSQERRDELAKEYDLIKGKDVLGRTQFVLLNKEIVKGLGVEKIEK